MAALDEGIVLGSRLKRKQLGSASHTNETFSRRI